MYYYDKQTQGFLVEGLHSIPESAVKISDELHRTLIEGQSVGKQIVTGLDGLPMLAEPQPSQFHEWDGSQWVISEEQQAEYLAQLKASKLNEINQKAQEFVANVAKLHETPEFEQATWQEQVNEVRAWHADNNTPTPKLALLATLRGVPLDVLRRKCFEKAQAFYMLSFATAGQRQRYEDMLKSAVNIEQVLAIEPVFAVEGLSDGNT